MTEIVATAIVALGGNMSSSSGAPAQTLHDAVAALANEGFAIRAVSRFFKTPCFPVGAGPDYVNAAVLLDFAGSPEDYLARLHRIEADFGRERVERWGRRTLDLDLLAVNGLVSPDLETFRAWQSLDPEKQAQAAPDQLILPHPRIQDRGFVLVPVADIAPDWMHPVLGKSITQMLTEIPASGLQGIDVI